MLKAVGVLDMVGREYRPEPISDETIVALQTLMASVLPGERYPYLSEEITVEVVCGPLQGVPGMLLRKEKWHRLVSDVCLIRQAAAAEFDINGVVPIIEGVMSK